LFRIRLHNNKVRNSAKKFGKVFMKINFIYLLLFSTQLFAQSSPPQFTAVQVCGVVGVDGQMIPNAVAIASNGDSYTTGSFRGTVILGSVTLTTSGYEDVFVTKQDAAGNYLWAAQAGGSLSDTGISLALDSNGNVCLAGEFQSKQATFGSTTLAHTYCTGCPKTFVAKLNPTGTWLWARQSTAGDYSGTDTAAGLAVDATDNIYLTGSFSSRNLVLGGLMLTNSMPLLQRYQTGTPDLYVAKLSPDGTWLWAVSGGGIDEEQSVGIALDNAQNVYVAGSTESASATFGSTTLTSTGYSNVVLLKLNISGAWQQVAQGGSNKYTYPTSLAVAADGTAYIAGQYTSTTTFGPTSLTSLGKYDGFVAQLSPAGTWNWATSCGGTENDYSQSIALDKAGNAYVIGEFTSPVLRAGATSLLDSTTPTFDIFAAKLDAQGSWQWALSAGGTKDDLGQCIALDNQGGLYLLGRYQSPLIQFGSFTLAGSSSTAGSPGNRGYLARLGNAVLSTAASQAAVTFEAYPSPSSGAIWLKGGVTGQPVAIYNLTGQLVYHTTVPANNTTPLLLPASVVRGVYLVRSGSSVCKLQVQ
jgi:hypothetical protein